MVGAYTDVQDILNNAIKMNSFPDLVRNGSRFVFVKTKLFMLFVFVFAFARSAVAAPFVLTEADKKCLEQFQEPIRLFYAYDFFYLESSDGKRSGALTPVIEILENHFGLKVETQKARRDEALQFLKNGQADLYGFIDVSPDQPNARWATPALLRTEGAIVSHRDALIGSPLNLRGKRIGVFKNATIGRPIRHYAAPDGVVVEFAALPEMVAALEKKEIDCFAVINTLLAEIQNHPFIQFDFTLSNFSLEMGIISNNDKMKPLIDLIRRYVESSQGDDLKNGIARQRNETILQVLQKYLKADIDFVQKNYDLIKIYDSCVLYPHCFNKESKQEGFLVEICDILTRLTEVPCKIDEWNCGDDGLPAALQKIKTDEIHFTSGAYSNLPAWKKDGFSWSLPICRDTIRPYSYKKNVNVFNNVRVACPPNVVPYFQWNQISKKPVQVLKTRRNLFDALKNKECDIIFIGEMSFNYRAAVLNQYDLYENTELFAESEMRLISGPQHAALNRLMDEAIQMYSILYPKAMDHWNEKTAQIKTDHIRHQESEKRKFFYAGAVVLGFLPIILLLLYRFMRYDWQIRRLLQKQQTFDLAWGNLRTKTLTSKGDHSLYKRWGFQFNRARCSFEELNRILGGDWNAEFRAAIDQMKEDGTDLLVQDQSVLSPLDGSDKYYRRFTHRLNNNHFMLCTKDITAQVEAERQERFLVELFEVLPNGFVFLDNEMNVLRYSKAVGEIFPGYDLTKKTCYEIFRNRNTPCPNCPIRQSLVDGQKHSKIEYVESEKKWIEIISYPVKDPATGEINRVLEFLNDITEHYNNLAAIRKSEERFRQLYMSMSNTLILLDVVRNQDGKVVDFIIAHANPAIKDYTGQTPESLIGASFLDLSADFDIETIGLDGKWWDGIALAANGIRGNYHCIIHSIPTSPYHEAIVFPCGENQVALLLYDETYRIRLQESLQTMQVVIDHLSDPVVWLYMDGTIQYVNLAAAKAVGYDLPGVKPDGPIGEKIWKFTPAFSEEKWDDFIQCFETERTRRIETNLLTRQNKIIPMAVTLDLITQQSEPLLVACFHDLSEQTKRIEIEQATLTKTRFLDRMSQELRTPINGIVGLTNILRSTNLDSRQLKYVELARSSGMHLLTLINKILDYSKIDSDEIEFNFSEFDLWDLIGSVLAHHAAQAAKQGLEMCALVQRDVPRFLIGDAERLRELLILKFGNALQSTREGGIKLTVSQERTNDVRPITGNEKNWNFFRFEVEDTGIGLSEEMIAKVGNLPIIEDFSGDGLGLSIARQLVALMGGKTGIQSRKSVGGQGGWSNFWFTLPLHFNETETRQMILNESFSDGDDDLSLTFAVADAWLRENIIEQFKRYGMDIRVFSDIASTLKSMRQAMREGKLKQILITDTNLEDGNALELIEQVRNDLLLDETRIGLLFSVEEKQEDIDLLNDKVDCLIGKPLVGPFLVKTVLQLIEKEIQEGSDSVNPDSTGKDDSEFKDQLIPYEQQRKKWKQLAESESSFSVLGGPYPDTMLWNDSKEAVGVVPSESQQPPTILVVEDHHVNRIVVGEILKQAGFRFEFAENGLQACNAVVAKNYALILMDCQMPVMDGFEATRKIRVLEAGLDDRKPKHSGRIPIIALTGNTQKKDEQRCFAVGMDDFCPKPVDSEKLIAVVRRWMPDEERS